MRPVRLELSAVIFALAEGRGGLEPVVATTRGAGVRDLPTAAFDPDRHRTLELSLRDWVAQSAGAITASIRVAARRRSSQGKWRRHGVQPIAGPRASCGRASAR